MAPPLCVGTVVVVHFPETARGADKDAEAYLPNIELFNVECQCGRTPFVSTVCVHALLAIGKAGVGRMFPLFIISVKPWLAMSAWRQAVTGGVQRKEAAGQGAGEAVTWKETRTPLAVNLRACTPWLPGHLDPDVHGLMPHYYLAGRAKQDGLVSRGCALFVASGQNGGQVAEVNTDCGEGELLVVGFSPSEQLHWVEDRGCSKVSVDKTGVRVIPFNNRWL